MIDDKYMRRAIELARHGLGNTSPNPMVGAVVVHNGIIIGEGYHRRCGEGHAEVNAIASVKDKSLLREATIYVTLEPCSHYGKTPPCAQLIIDSGIPRAAVGCLDPFEKVSGRGVSMLREAGVDVTVGVLEKECRDINPVFMTAHTLKRPYITLKWAQSSDGFMDRDRTPGEQPQVFSTPLTATLSHRLRTLNDAIMVGNRTVITDNPALTPRRWKGRTPVRVIADRSGLTPPDATVMTDGMETIILGQNDATDIAGYMKYLYAKGITSVLVEGGATLHRSFLREGLWDVARVEISPVCLGEGVMAPAISAIPQKMLNIGRNKLIYYMNNGISAVKKN